MLSRVKSSYGTWRVLFGSPERLAGTVYGTIVVMATIAAGATGNPDAWKLATVVASTVVVLWAAHVYAASLGESISGGKRLGRSGLASITRAELGIPLAAVGPVVVLVLGAVGVFAEATAVWLALGLGLLTLGVEGVRYARIERLSAPGTLAVVSVNLVLGLVIVGLKAALAH
jgi:hypothetical protein